MNNQPPPPEYPEGAPVPSSTPVPASFDPLSAGIGTAPMPSSQSSAWQPDMSEEKPKSSSFPLILVLIAVIIGCIAVVACVAVLTISGLALMGPAVGNIFSNIINSL